MVRSRTLSKLPWVVPLREPCNRSRLRCVWASRTLQFRLEGSGQFSGSEPGDDKFAGADIDSSEASLRACGSNGNEIIVLPRGKQVGFGEGTRGEDAGYRALDDTFTDFAYLVADGDFVAALNQFAHVIFQGVQGYTREGNPAVLSILAGGEDNL